MKCMCALIPDATTEDTPPMITTMAPPIITDRITMPMLPTIPTALPEIIPKTTPAIVTSTFEVDSGFGRPGYFPPPVVNNQESLKKMPGYENGVA